MGKQKRRWIDDVYDCVYFVSVDYDSTTAFTRQFPAPRSFDRSCVAIFFRRRENVFRPRENLGKKSLGRRDRFRPKFVEIGAILATFKPFQVLKIHMPLLGEFSRSSQDSCESDYDSHKSWDDRLNSPKSGRCQKVSGKLFTQKNKIDTAI